MAIGGRSLRTIAGAITKPEHYRALLGMFARYPHPIRNLGRYLSAGGTYPYDCALRTPLGRTTVLLDSHHDLLTVNEVFCREDYRPPQDLRVVVDIGSNIGISALYFLTRNVDVYAYLYEPVARNVVRLQRNLGALAGRFEVAEIAVADTAGEVTFGIESTGRYGGIGLELDGSIVVRCEEINSVLEPIILRHGTVDLLKLDTEGAEPRTVAAIEPRLLRRIRIIYLEMSEHDDLPAGPWAEHRRGTIRMLVPHQT